MTDRICDPLARLVVGFVFALDRALCRLNRHP